MAGPRYEDGYWYSADGLRLHFREITVTRAITPLLCSADR